MSQGALGGSFAGDEGLSEDMRALNLEYQLKIVAVASSNGKVVGVLGSVVDEGGGRHCLGGGCAPPNRARI